jgi:ribosomal protein S18 acetylase RimI-like enzyme
VKADALKTVQLEMVWPAGRRRPAEVKLEAHYRLHTGGPHDAEAWCALMVRVGFTELGTLEALAPWQKMLLPDGWWFVEHVPDWKLVATAMALDRPSERHPRGGELGWVAADPDHAGHRLGAAVCAAATRTLLESSLRPIYLLTDDDRLPALKTYLSLGYVPYIDAPDMPQRWRAVCEALDWPYTPDQWVVTLAPGMRELVARHPRKIQLTGPTAYAPRFAGPPTLTWEPVDGAATYRVRVADENGIISDGRVIEPRIDLASIWDRLPDGPVDVLLQGYDPSGAEYCIGEHRRLFKVPGFDGMRQEPLDWLGAVRRNVEYLLAPARDEVRPYEQGLPRGCWSSFEESITGQRFMISYPALHHPSYIVAFLLFAERFADDELAPEARRQALQYGEWLLAHHHPEEWVCSSFPYSTIADGRYEGGNEGRTITLFRAARVGEAMVALHEHDGDPRWLAYARKLADVFVDLQRADGSWPYRVDPATGEVIAEYTSNAITPARLFAMLEKIEPDERLRAARERALAWLFENPVRTGLWQGMYEDIAEFAPFQNLQHWDTNELIRYIAYAYADDPKAIRIAVDLNAYVEDQFVVSGRERGPVFVQSPTPLVLEQYACYHPMDVHTATWLLSLAALHSLTRDRMYLDKGVAAANAIVRSQQPHGAFSNWGLDQRFDRPLNTVDWASCNACTVIGLLRWWAFYESLGSDEPYRLGLWGI